MAETCLRLAPEDITPDILAQIERISVTSFPPSELEPFSVLADSLRRGDVALFVACVGEAIAGFGVTLKLPIRDTVYLAYLAVDPDRRGQGIGGRLFRTTLEVSAATGAGTALVWEVERPERGAPSEDPKRRRIAFYQRLGGILLDHVGDFRMPDLTLGPAVDVHSALPAALMWATNAERPAPTRAETLAIVAAVYRVGYGRDLADPLVRYVFSTVGLDDEIIGCERVPNCSDDQIAAEQTDRKGVTLNKRDRVLSLLDPGTIRGYVPAAFFMHFGPTYREGEAAIERHLAYFHHTGMDFVKIQYEHAFPPIPEIRRPEDWARMPHYGDDFYAAPLKVVEGLVRAARHEALVLVTLYSPFMCAGHTTSDELVTEHMKLDPEAVKSGLEIITDSLMGFVRGCIQLGVDGFYASTQGGEAHRFAGTDLFASYVKPYDIVLMEEADGACPFNILHICDYCGGYDDLTPFLDYPLDVVNCSLQVGDRAMMPHEVSDLFGRPFMGGMDRHGVIASGNVTAVREEVNAVLSQAPDRFILGADCTIPGDTDWDVIRAAVDVAHVRGR